MNMTRDEVEYQSGEFAGQPTPGIAAGTPWGATVDKEN